MTLWRELFTRAASAEDGASKQLARRQAYLFLKDHMPSSVRGRDDWALNTRPYNVVQLSFKHHMSGRICHTKKEKIEQTEDDWRE